MVTISDISQERFLFLLSVRCSHLDRFSVIIGAILPGYKNREILFVYNLTNKKNLLFINSLPQVGLCRAAVCLRSKYFLTGYGY